jgi:ribosomal protein S20
MNLAKDALQKAMSQIQKSASKRVIHKNKASRLISRLTARVNQLEASNAQG